MTRGGEVRFVRITANPTQVNAPWWTASRVAQPDARSAHKLAAMGACTTCIVMPRQAEAFRVWATSIPGWNEGLFTFEEVDLPEVLRAIGYRPAPRPSEVDKRPELRGALSHSERVTRPSADPLATAVPPPPSTVPTE